jgi:3-methyladenine DNA glycosylase AlkD
MPTVLRVGGYRFYFWSRENREPPHSHVEQAERYAQFWLSPVSLADARGFRSNELREIRRLVEEHRAHFEEQWHEHLRSQGPQGPA